MTVRDVIKETARLVGDETLFKALNENAENSDDETKEKTEIMLKCFNDTFFEIATEIYPIEAEEEIAPGKVLFDDLSVYPQKIKRVRKNGENIGFYVGVGYFETSGGGTVTYEKFPTEKILSDEFEYEKTVVNKTVFGYGMAAEFCLITGRFSESLNWENRYKNAVAPIMVKRGRSGKIRNSRVWR